MFNKIIRWVKAQKLDLYIALTLLTTFNLL